MNIKVEKTVYLELDKREVELFDIMLKLAMRRLEEWEKIAMDKQFKMVGTEEASFSEERMFIEDLMRGISR